MPKYNVHTFREMRVRFNGIEAETPHEAARIARDKRAEEADLVDSECDGTVFSALVDEQGDEEYSKTKMIDFAPQRKIDMFPRLLKLLSEAMGVIISDVSPDNAPAYKALIAELKEAANAP